MQNDYISRMASTPVKKVQDFFQSFLEEIAMKDRGSRTSFLHPSKMRDYFQILLGGNSSGKITILEL